MAVNSLDPDDWEAARLLAHRIIDDSVEHIKSIRSRPVWLSATKDIFDAKALEEDLPFEGEGPERVYEKFLRDVRPYQLGNAHPGFFGWYLGAGTFFGALADFLASLDNPSVAGGQQVGVQLEKQVLDWWKKIVGFPSSAAGLLLSGASMGTVVALTVARNSIIGPTVRTHGMQACLRQVSVYASAEAHMSVRRACELIGLGSEALREVPTTQSFTLDTNALQNMIEKDISDGRFPLCVVATVGTTNTGSIDDVQIISKICKQFSLWCHVDGAIGIPLLLSPRYSNLLEGINLADSIAFDFHKWMSIPIDAGGLLIKDRASHYDTFAANPSYLARKDGLVSDDMWFSDYGPELTRRLRALKIWFSLKEHGIVKYGKVVENLLGLTQSFSRLAASSGKISLAVPPRLNIVCFRYDPGGVDAIHLDRINRQILSELHDGGSVFPSSTLISGAFFIRAAFVNHRTNASDVTELVETILTVGDRICGYSW